MYCCYYYYSCCFHMKDACVKLLLSSRRLSAASRPCRLCTKAPHSQKIPRLAVINASLFCRLSGRRHSSLGCGHYRERSTMRRFTCSFVTLMPRPQHATFSEGEDMNGVVTCDLKKNKSLDHVAQYDNDNIP